MSSRDLVLAANGSVSAGPTFVSSSISYVTTSSNTVTAPTGIQNGDLLVAVGFRTTSSGLTVQPTSGFNVQCFENITNNVLFVASKVASFESGNYTFFWTDAVSNAIAILVYRNAKKVNIVGVKASNPSSATNTVSSITPTYVGALLAVFGNFGTPRAISSAPSGMTQRAFTSNNVNLAVYDQAPQEASATGTRGIVWDSGGNVGGLLLQVTNEPTVAPEFVAIANTQNVSLATSLVINKPTGTVENDLMVAVMAADGSSTWTGGTGWTEAADLNASPALRIAYKVAVASEPSSYTFTAAVSELLSGCILSYRYAAYDTIGSFATNATGIVLPSISPAESQSILIAAAARADPSISMGILSTMTDRINEADATAPSYTVGSQEVAKGPTGTRYVLNSTITGSAGIMLSIKPTRSL